MEGVVRETTQLSTLTSEFVAAGSSAVSKIRGTTAKLAVEGTRDDVSTGATPRKRTWDVVESWERTKGREEVLREWKHRQTRQQRQPAPALSVATTIGNEDQLEEMEGLEGEAVEQGQVAGEEGSPETSSVTLPAVQEPRGEKQPAEEQLVPPQTQAVKPAEQPMRFGDLPTGPLPSLLKPATESAAAAAPPAKPTQMKKPRSVSGSISGKPPSTGARKAAPLSEKPVNVVGARGGLRRVTSNGAGR
ncbi:kinesin motor protein cin8 [Tulasnella sp. 417]|nr:kinesin motor protein cin8 [Tulasnella sp. 417]